jgi:hypothetical protein
MEDPGDTAFNKRWAHIFHSVGHWEAGLGAGRQWAGPTMWRQLSVFVVRAKAAVGLAEAFWWAVFAPDYFGPVSQRGPGIKKNKASQRYVGTARYLIKQEQFERGMKWLWAGGWGKESIDLKKGGITAWTLLKKPTWLGAQHRSLEPHTYSKLCQCLHWERERERDGEGEGGEGRRSKRNEK